MYCCISVNAPPPPPADALQHQYSGCSRKALDLKLSIHRPHIANNKRVSEHLIWTFQTLLLPSRHLQARIRTLPFWRSHTQFRQATQTFDTTRHKPCSPLSQPDTQEHKYLLHYHNDKYSNEADAWEQDSYHYQHSLGVVCHIILPLSLHELFTTALTKEILMTPASKHQHKFLSAPILSGAKDAYTHIQAWLQHLQSFTWISRCSLQSMFMKCSHCSSTRFVSISTSRD